MDSAAIGARVIALRTQQGMSTTDLARRVGISQAQISRLENGLQGYRSATLDKIARALGVEPVYLIIDENDAKAPNYGAIAGKRVFEAMRSPEFLRAAEGLAELYRKRKDAFKSVAGVIAGLADSGRAKR